MISEAFNELDPSIGSGQLLTEDRKTGPEWKKTRKLAWSLSFSLNKKVETFIAYLVHHTFFFLSVITLDMLQTPTKYKQGDLKLV